MITRNIIPHYFAYNTLYEVPVAALEMHPAAAAGKYYVLQYSTHTLYEVFFTGIFRAFFRCDVTDVQQQQ